MRAVEKRLRVRIKDLETELEVETRFIDCSCPICNPTSKNVPKHTDLDIGAKKESNEKR